MAERAVPSRATFVVALFSLLGVAAGYPEQQTLLITPEQIRVEESAAGGYHVWVQQVSGIGSVLVTESSADLEKRLHSYALRTPTPVAATATEKRMLDGEFLDPGSSIYSIIDSTPEDHPELGAAFHVFLPPTVLYGYPWTRSGQIEVGDGTFLNLRAFAKEFADYSGPFADNPFVLRVSQRVVPREVVAGEYLSEAVESFALIAREGGGRAIRSSGQADVVDRVADVLDGLDAGRLDLVLALDTTKSMEDDMPHLKERIVPLLASYASKFSKIRLGLLLYRDYGDEYLVRPYPFVDSFAAVQRNIDAARVRGGRDIPEAVFEALYSSIHDFSWDPTADARQIVLIGDAPPHPTQRGRISKEMVYADARERQIHIDTIILPSK